MNNGMQNITTYVHWDPLSLQTRCTPPPPLLYFENIPWFIGNILCDLSIFLFDTSQLQIVSCTIEIVCLKENCSVCQYNLLSIEESVYESYRTPRVAANHDHSFDSPFPARATSDVFLPMWSVVRLLVLQRRRWRFCGGQGVMARWGMPGKFQKEQQRNK